MANPVDCRPEDRDRLQLVRDLGERIKELRALRTVAELLLDDRAPLPDLLHTVAAVLPPAMQFPAAAAARVTCGGDAGLTAGFRETPWRLFQSFDTAAGAAGTIEVVYLEPCLPAAEDPFLAEERSLIVSVGQMLRGYLDRRAAREALEASEGRLRAIVEAVPECVKTVSTDGRLLAINSAGLALLEVPDPGAVIGRNVIDLVHPDDRDAYWDLHTRIARGGTGELRFRIIGMGGTERWMETRSTALFEADGSVGAVLSVTRDVTERHRAEEALRTSEQHLREMADNIGDIFFSYDPARNRFLYASRAYERIWGRPLDAVLANPLSSYLDGIHPLDRPRVNAAMGQLAAGRPSETTFRVVRPDGSIRWVHERAVPIRSTGGRLERVVGTIRDITEARAAEATIREQAALLDLARDAILVLDLHDRILYWNRGAERLYGWTREEVLGRAVAGLMDRDRSQLVAASRAVGETGEWTGELEQVTKAGRRIVVEGRWTLVRDEEGHPRSILAINTDITERRQMAAQLLRTQRLESIGTLAGGMAHDLNNVLAPILMSVASLRELVHTSDGQALLDTLESSAQRGADLIRQVLQFARGIEGERAPLDVGQVVADLAKLARDTFPKNIDVRVDAPQAPWRVRGDCTQVHQVLVNLCVNARDAMPGGGCLTVSLDNIMVDERTAAAYQGAIAGPHVRIQVRDTGTGMAPSVMDRIFDPFFTTKEPGRGTGLGLSTALAIVRSHRGFITVSSVEGGGSTFGVHLPAEPCQDREEPRAEHRELPPRGRGETILIVDDEEAVRRVAQAMLERFGYTVLTARDGAEALALYRRGPVAVVLTDMTMPVMDGPALAHALYTLDPNARIIASSGHAAPDGVSDFTSAGVRHFVPKPYTADTMLRTIRQVLDSTS